MTTDPARGRSRLVPPRTLALIAALVLGGLPAGARADGDPASDVLASQTVFVPADAGGSTAQQGELAAVVAQATSRGLPIRVAVISSPSDLGSVSALWRQPQGYAQFLGQELSLIFSGQLLVAMPNGFGLYHAGAHQAAELAALDRFHHSRPDTNLPTTATHAVRVLAAATGHVLPQPRPSAPPPARGATGSRGPLAWAVVAAGAAIVLLAWTASLRARPLQPVTRRASVRSRR